MYFNQVDCSVKAVSYSIVTIKTKGVPPLLHLEFSSGITTGAFRSVPLGFYSENEIF